ncbi:allophanate hydrolase subunit 1 [Aliiroseovarius sp.]|uniref:5-oxoprolinase subunit B family protein n=1 Tax=Aliiroseovarius sp. TaxID=1872442 RepID=UPI00261EC17E|nr:allophanate hydrolase subunit 1 [Aliiroseovarius sp.]
MTALPRFTPVAEHALLVQLAEEVGDRAARAVLALDKALADRPPEGLVEVVPALVNLLVEFDPVVTDHADMQAAVAALLDHAPDHAPEVATHDVAVCYDPDLGPDLAAVARATGQSEEAVIAAHLGGGYRVGMYGFAPGYAYLTGLDPALHVPRKPTALRDVPAGSVIIAGPQCLVTTLKMPTGWSILGSSPARILTGDPSRPFLFNVGDHVRFTRIDRAAFEAMGGAPA